MNDCFEYIKKSLKNKSLDNVNLNDYETYYRNTWTQYLDKGILNYHNIEKFKRANSFLENYNKHIKQVLSPFLYNKKKGNIESIYFLGFISEKENFLGKN